MKPLDLHCKLIILLGVLISLSEAWISIRTYTVQRRANAAYSQLYFNDFFKSLLNEKNDDASPPIVEKQDIQSKQESDSSYSDDDPVEKLFNFFFGKKEENPFGLARFGRSRFPEQYPAVKDEWALPVSTDDKEMALIRPFLKGTNLEMRALKLTYDANRNGWNAAAFHRCVDRLGGGIVVCVSKSGLVCGGYNPKGWVSYGEYRGSIAAFLFVLGGKYAQNDFPGYKLQKVGGPGLAQIDLPEAGPSFGADSLVIPLRAENPRIARSKLGSYYERFPDGGSSLFGNDSSVQLKEFRVYQGVYEEGEYIPFTDAEPFALS
jgi:hypothetical protein